jgi:hypothetical protein
VKQVRLYSDLGEDLHFDLGVKHLPFELRKFFASVAARNPTGMLKPLPGVFLKLQRFSISCPYPIHYMISVQQTMGNIRISQ